MHPTTLLDDDGYALVHPKHLLCCLAFLCLTCTDAGLYAVGAQGVGGPDRADIKGTVCVPLASGEAFPVKVLFALEGGAGLDRQIVSQATDALNSLADRFSDPYIKFGLVAYHSVATGLQGQFVNAAALAPTIAKYSSYQEAGPVSARSALMLAKSLLSGDMQTGCRGLVARTRYLVVLVMANKDTACSNPAFNAGIDAKCNAFAPNEAQCSSCELGRVTEDLKNLSDQYLAGEVVVQPVYVRSTQDLVASAQGAVIARNGGTQLVETDPANLKNALNSLNYASLQAQLKMKRLIAFNRNSIARNGKLLVDSDGDGISDDDEIAMGTDPTLADTDGDGLSDNVELRMGLKPQAGNIDVINGCNPYLDSDGDRLNDCEEHVLGTDACISDTDGDGISDFVELHQGTRPLIPEDLRDDDRDGISNIEEVAAHTDVTSADVAFAAEHGYRYFIEDAPPTVDGRACYNFRINNIGLVSTLARPNPPFETIKQGTNDIYIYFQVGRANDPRGTGVGSLFVQQVQWLPPNTRRPPGIISVLPTDFVSSE